MNIDDPKKERERMRIKYSAKDELFYYPPCLVPAWEPLIDEMIELIEEWNNTESNQLRFFQIKEKFGMMVVYLEPVDGSGVVATPMHIQDAVNSIANNGIKICKICGERKVQTVVESRLQWKCIDHWNEKQWFAARGL
tara:strand:- start:975 stop:1388 length:414 start_codon:yes stop_codon:yes gene_type:complete